MEKHKIVIDGSSLSIADVALVSRNVEVKVSITDSAKEKINVARSWVEKSIVNNDVVYGLSTGFGSFKNKVIKPEEAIELQLNIARSHACGVGAPFTKEVVRAMMLLRANSLAQGYSGIRLSVVEKILEYLNHDIYPFVPQQGSVGSSGDLAPLCHMILTLIGEGECLVDGKRVPTADVLASKKISPVVLSSKEGLALSNGTNAQTSVLTLATYDALNLLESADVIAALSVEVLMGSRKPFDPRVSKIRGQLGQIECANNIATLLAKSPIIDSHKNCGRVQDAYSLRCIPQVHGASRDSITHVKHIVEREINAVTDNPLIFAEDDCAISGGNFHGEPIAQAADFLKIAVAELANISERRVAKMIDPATNDGLPAFLMDPSKGGLHSGLMIPQYVAAALVSENKTLAHPASVDSIPTSANQEDHVSMGTIAARHAALIVENTKNVLAIELLNNTQAYEFRSENKLCTSSTWLYDEVRKFVPPCDADRPFYLDIERLRDFVGSRTIYNYLTKNVPEWRFA